MARTANKSAGRKTSATRSKSTSARTRSTSSRSKSSGAASGKKTAARTSGNGRTANVSRTKAKKQIGRSGLIQKTTQAIKKMVGKKQTKKIRYAVVGLGHITQNAVLPAFEHAGENCELAALVSSDTTKLKKLGKKYDIENLYLYEEYEQCLTSGEIDAVYIALPNSMHRDYAIKAATCGVHVLCEKPMAVTEEDCEAMIEAAEDNNVKLMIAYRLHFEEANLGAIEIVTSGKIGEPRIFNSVFSMQVKEGDIRTQKKMGGGSLYDIGIYCINAARYLFRDEPIEVTAMTASSDDERFEEVEEITSAVMRFSDDRVASFTCSFGSTDAAMYQVLGTKGMITVNPAFEYEADLKYEVTIEGRTNSKRVSRRDQFAPELVYFADCILKNKKPEPDGNEGLIDVRIIEAIYQSAKTGKTVRLDDMFKQRRPTMQMEMKKPRPRKPELVNTEAPHK
jgi:predicted dehydrogenase